MADCSMEGAEETSAPVNTRITSKKWQSMWEYYLLPESDLAPGIVKWEVKPDRNFDTARS